MIFQNTKKRKNFEAYKDKKQDQNLKLKQHWTSQEKTLETRGKSLKKMKHEDVITFQACKISNTYFPQTPDQRIG